jgi:hypothetical protein
MGPILAGHRKPSQVLTYVGEGLMTTQRRIRSLRSMYSLREITWARSIVDHAFDSAVDKHAYLRQNPILGGDFVPDDPIQELKDPAIRAVLARLWHAKKYALHFDLQPLPLGRDEREEMQKRGSSRSHAKVVCTVARCL